MTHRKFVNKRQMIEGREREDKNNISNGKILKRILNDLNMEDIVYSPIHFILVSKE